MFGKLLYVRYRAYITNKPNIETRTRMNPFTLASEYPSLTSKSAIKCRQYGDIENMMKQKPRRQRVVGLKKSDIMIFLWKENIKYRTQEIESIFL